MDYQQIFKSLLFALLAAIGNAIFAYGQKKSVHSDNPFVFILFSVLICLLFLVVAFFLYGKTDVSAFFSHNMKWVLVSGSGFFITFMGFYFLYTGFGASYYLLYAILSIVTTSIFLGVVVFRETFNLYIFLSLVSSAVTIVLFAIGSLKD